jgi:hypothetical protein
MGNICASSPCCGGPRIPTIKVNIDSNCCRDNRNLKIVIHNEEDMQIINKLFQEIHRASLKRVVNASTATLNSNINL